VNVKRKAKKKARYAAHLRSPSFRALRKQAFERDGYRCVDCGGSEKLEADHRTYARVPNELLEDLETRCKDCHLRRHALQGKKVGRNPEHIAPIVQRVMDRILRRPTKGVA
jgi:5-methylcytosine-specific restriction protein A